ncbi:MAG: UvrD-helicase domain-containing protein [Thermoanaerobaculales bacterium]|nr:UvrD-helicase domain-containing protein [Thermoanaerobaculales bacterium]
MDQFLENLNDAQREAVIFGEGPLLVLAGAGSGKTRVLTHRVAHIVARGDAEPFEITAVTFTNKAAREMRERAETLVRDGRGLGGAFLGTFHRWALEVLRRWPEAAGLPRRFSILDPDDQRALMTRLLKEERIDTKDHPPRAVLGRISGHVNRMEGVERLEARSGDNRAQITARLWNRYTKEKKALGAVDFDDMLAQTLDVLRREEVVRKAVMRRARYLLVDEFQDTNKLQMKMLLTVLAGGGNITAVGDEDQSIYRWRGAEMDNILGFEKHFAGAHIVSLERNYRSTQPILEASGALIAQNIRRHGKTLFTEQDGGEPVRLFVADDERHEARWTVDRISELESEHGLGEMAVLMRTNAQTRPFEEELMRRRIAYRVVGGLRFWQRAEVKDALAYLRQVVRPDDEVAFRRVVNVPARGIGAATIDVLKKHAAGAKALLPVAARDLPESLMPRARVALGRYFELLDEAQSQREILDPADFVGWLLETTGLLGLYDGDEEEKVVRRENLRQLASAVAEASAQGQTLEDFLDGVALFEDSDEETSPDVVRLMTLHGAKGMEFDVVFVAGMEDGLLPHANSREEEEGVEEERRLAYVGMTRARRWLGLTAARRRFLFGQSQNTQLSRFLLDISADQFEDVSDQPWQMAPSDEPEEFGTVVASRGRHQQRSAGSADSAPPIPSRRSTGRKIGAVVTDGSGVGWRPGDRVRHRRFGTGVVLSCRGRGPQLQLVVYFDRGGRKTLVPTIAKLEKL